MKYSLDLPDTEYVDFMDPKIVYYSKEWDLTCKFPPGCKRTSEYNKLIPVALMQEKKEFRKAFLCRILLNDFRRKYLVKSKETGKSRVVFEKVSYSILEAVAKLKIKQKEIIIKHLLY